VERSSGAAPSRRLGGGENRLLPLDVRVEDVGASTSIVALTGELDLSTIARIEAQLFEQLRARPRVIVDLTRLTFIDSSGIGTLIRTSQAFANGRRMQVVIGLGSQVDRVFRIAGIGEVLPLFSSREDAVASLEEGMVG
jgi:anti-sigma B factor antagonist